MQTYHAWMTLSSAVRLSTVGAIVGGTSVTIHSRTGVSSFVVIDLSTTCGQRAA